MKAIEFSGAGGPEVLRAVDRPRPTPGPGEVLVAVEAAGVNRPEKRIAEALLARVWPLLASRRIVVPLQRVLPLDEAAEPHRMLDENLQMGKIVLTMDGQEARA